MRFIINYFRQCFCKHEWELMFDVECRVHDIWDGGKEVYHKKIYRCKKCGYSKKYTTK